MDTRKYGRVGEEFAISFLQKAGYKILEKNFRSYVGEIDIIARSPPKFETLVFVEVKTRWSRKFGAPEEAVTPRKLWHIKRTGEYYLLKNPGLPKKIRIEVVAIEIAGGRVTSAKIIKAD